MIISWIMLIWNTFYNFIYAFIDLGNSIVSFFNNIFFFLPEDIRNLMMIGILIIIALVLYHYLKDIEIGGFKI